jgi:hypothetical protein
MSMSADRSRRDFLAKMTALSVTGVVGGNLALDSVGAPDCVPLDGMRPEHFSKHVGQTFTILDDERRIDAVLTEVTRSRSVPGSRQPFSLTFRTAADESVPHRTYVVEHALLGRMQIFLGAVDRPTSEQDLQAIFA